VIRYDGEADDIPAPAQPAPVKAEPQIEPVKQELSSDAQNYDSSAEIDFKGGDGDAQADHGMQGMQSFGAPQNGNGPVGQQQHDDDYDRPIGIKEDG